MATADTSVQTDSASAIYQFQGTLLEACNCDVLCPCWIGEDPDNGTCSSVVAEMEPYRGADGSITTLQNSIFSTVPGSPAWVGKAARFAVDMPDQGWTYSFEGSN